MAEQEDTSREYVSRISSFTYCGKGFKVGDYVKNLCMKYSPSYKAYAGDVHTDKIIEEGNYCGEHNDYWQLMCEDCARKLGIEW